MRQLWLLLLLGLVGASTIPSKETEKIKVLVLSPEEFDEYSDLDGPSFDLSREFDEEASQSHADSFEEKDPTFSKEKDDLSWEEDNSQEEDDDSLEQDNSSEENEGPWEGHGRRKHLWRVNGKEHPRRAHMKIHWQRRQHKHGLSTDDQEDVRNLGRRYRVASRKTPEKTVFSSEEDFLTDRELTPEERQEIRNMGRRYRVHTRKMPSEKDGAAPEQEGPYRKDHPIRRRPMKGLRQRFHARRNSTQMGPRAHWRQAKRQHRRQFGWGPRNMTLHDNSTQGHGPFPRRTFHPKLHHNGTRPTMEDFCKMMETPRRMHPSHHFANRRKDHPQMEERGVFKEDLKECCDLEDTEDRMECFKEAKRKHVDRCCEDKAPLPLWGKGPRLRKRITAVKDKCCSLKDEERYACFGRLMRGVWHHGAHHTNSTTQVPRRRWPARRQHRRRFHQGSIPTDEEILPEDSEEDQRTTMDGDEDKAKTGAKPSRRKTKRQCCLAGKELGVSLTTEPRKETCKAEADIFPEISAVDKFQASCKATFYWCCSRTASKKPDMIDEEEDSLEEDDDMQEPLDAELELAEDDFQEEYDDLEDLEEEVDELEDAWEEWDEELEKDVDSSKEGEKDPLAQQNSKNGLF